MFHVNDDGDVKVCKAVKKACLFAIHGETVKDTQNLYESQMNHSIIPTLQKFSELSSGLELPGVTNDVHFDKDTFYGKQSPREVQLAALNGIVSELEENDATQLIAACGTGKTYMHRQLLRNAMDAEDSNGIGVILTSSIRLAEDTASDLRPEGGYDESIGKFGEDYEVVEVHSGAEKQEGRQSVKVEGVISVDRIYNQIDAALKSGKKVVIVSTYDSVHKVQEAQARFADTEKVQADLLIHDEAHNILGQQRPTTVASDENDLTAYVGFHNDVPGSLQARKRLYSTATPVVRETEADKLPTGNIEDLVNSAKIMQEKAPNTDYKKERITIYSDDKIVGGVGGFISQGEAIDSKCLAKPSYEIRENVLKGSIKDFDDPVVNYRGELKERTENPADSDLNPKTYGALMSTINAMVADAEGDKNPATNVLAYVGSINQAEAFKKAFRDATLHESKGMSKDEAVKNVNSSDPELKRRARMLLLNKNADVKAAHSKTDSDSVQERKDAFEMFEGNAVKSTEWTSNKRVLANVNIFSEGVSISEIDTVVISDDDKLNEKSMTQAIGRAIRVVPGNNVKKYGHVIIPAVKDESGADLNSSSVNLAAYTSTKVERGSTASKLRGEPVSPDLTTNFKVYGSDGSVKNTLARDFAQNSVMSVEDLAASAEITSNRTYLMNDNPQYREYSRKEQFILAKERINDKIRDMKSDSTELPYYRKVQSHLANKSSLEVQEIARNGRVVASAISTGDISSIHPELATKLISKNILKTEQKVSEVTFEEKRDHLSKFSKEYSYAIITTPPNASDEHVAARNRLPKEILTNKKVMVESINSLKGSKPETENTRALEQSFNEALENEDFVNETFSALTGENKQNVKPLAWFKNRKSMEEDTEVLKNKVIERRHNEAVQGEKVYTVDPKSVRKTGEFRSIALRKLLKD